MVLALGMTDDQSKLGEFPESKALGKIFSEYATCFLCTFLYNTFAKTALVYIQ
jgi:hypothetical protein